MEMNVDSLPRYTTNNNRNSTMKISVVRKMANRINVFGIKNLPRVLFEKGFPQRKQRS